MNRRVVGAGIACLVAALCLIGHNQPAQAANKVVRVIRWSELAKAGSLLSGELAKPSDNRQPDALVVRVAEGAAPLAKVCVIDQPGVGGPAYMLRGKVRCEGVTEPGFVEMWNHFPEGFAYFTRTLAETGPMGHLAGTQDWRELALPFAISQPGEPVDAAKRPLRLEINVVLPRGGTVYLSDLELVQVSDLAGLNQALSPQGAGFGWPTLAAALLLGGQMLLVVLLSALAARGLASPTWMMRLAGAFAGVSALSLLCGLLAVALPVERAVQLQLLLGGLAGIGASALLIPGLRRKLHERELRQMQALDV
ncbi:MAG: hypothetical protein K1X74_07015 [Pirellulales bacterium]|nr:hypothetical protein [Pirellulales bacterium]